MTGQTSIDPAEVAKFEAMATEWWDPRGKFKPLHMMNPVRLDYVTTRLAAQNHTARDLRTIRAHQAAYAESVDRQDALAMIATNRDFHAAIAEAGRNPYYTSLFIRLLDEGRRILRLYYSSFHDRLPHRYVEEHDEMVAAIAARDVARADRIGRQHADQIVRQIQSYVARDRRQPIDL